MGKTTLTIEEAVGVCRNTRIPTILAEGKDDYIVYRRLESKLRHLNVDVIFLGGRESVLKVFEKRGQIGNPMVAYIVDKDMWVFNEIPPEYVDESLITTDGYSIENDMYRDGCLEDLMDENEFQKFYRDCKELLKWYSFAVSRHLANAPTIVDVHVDRVVDLNGNLIQGFLDEVGYSVYPGDIYNLVQKDYKKLVRGKTLFSLLLRYLSYKGRPASHRSESLLDHASARDGILFLELLRKVEALFLPPAKAECQVLSSTAP